MTDIDKRLDRLEAEISKRFNRIEVDMWSGDGPQHLSITARLAMIEKVLRNAQWAFRLTVMVFLTAVATLVVTLVKH